MNQACDFCGDPFDEGQRTPRALGCSGRHLMCTFCLKQLFFSTEYHCIFDGDKISMRNKMLDDFKIVNPGADIANPCSYHHNLTAKAFCIELGCRKNLCAGCMKAHEPTGHSLVAIADIPDKKKEIIRLLRDQIREAEDANTQKEKLLKIEKSRFLTLIENEFKMCREQLDAQEVIVKKKLEDFFRELGNKTSDREHALTDQIDTWKTQFEKEINSLEQSRQSDQSILYDLVSLKDATKRVGIADCIATLKETNKSYKTEADKISIKFAFKLKDFMKEQISTGVNFSNIEKMNRKDDKKPSFRADQNKDQNQNQDRGRNQENQQNREKSLKRKSSLKAQSRFGNQQNQNNERQEESKSNGRGRIVNGNPNRADSRSDIQRNIFNDIERAIEDLPILLDSDKVSDFALRAARHLSSEDAIKLEKNFKQLSPDALRTVTEINFNCEYLHGLGAEALGKFLQNLTSMTQLSLEFIKSEHMTLNDFDDIERSFSQLKQLVNLQLNLSRWRFLEDKTIIKLAEKISSFKHLETLTLNFSEGFKITNEGVKGMLDNFKKLTKLKTLYVFMRRIDNITNQSYQYITNFSDEMTYMKTISFDLFQCRNYTFPSENIHDPRLSIKKG